MRARAAWAATVLVLGCLGNMAANGMLIKPQVGHWDVLTDLERRPVAALSFFHRHQRYSVLEAPYASTGDVVDTHEYRERLFGIFLGDVFLMPPGGDWGIAPLENASIWIEGFSKPRRPPATSHCIHKRLKRLNLCSFVFPRIGADHALDRECGPVAHVLDSDFKAKAASIFVALEIALYQDNQGQPGTLTADKAVAGNLVGVFCGFNRPPHVSGLHLGILADKCHLPFASLPKLVSGPPQQTGEQRKNGSKERDEPIGQVIKKYFGPIFGAAFGIAVIGAVGARLLSSYGRPRLGLAVFSCGLLAFVSCWLWGPALLVWFGLLQ